MAGIAFDFREAARGLLRHRSVAALSLVCIALGVGTSAAMLGLLDALLFRTPAYVENPGGVKRVYVTDRLAGLGEYTSSTTSYPVSQDLERVKAFAGVGSFFATEVPVGRGAEAQKVSGVLATPGFFRLLGAPPLRGRLFTDAEGQPGQPAAVALLGYDFWRRGFGGAADIIGRQLIVRGVAYTIVGVLPPRFTGVDLEAVDLWLPMSSAGSFVSKKWATGRGTQFLEVVARPRPGVTETAAAQEATTVFRAAAAEAGRPKPSARVRLGPIQRAQGPDAPSSLRVVTFLTALSWVVLLIACANVASLLLLRGLDRQREWGLRVALGAGRGRIARLVICEGVLLALAGGVAASLVCIPIGALLQHLVLPEAGSVIQSGDLRRLGFVAVLTLAAGLLAGAVPALWTSRRDLTLAIRSSTRERTPGRSRVSLAISATQLALTLILLAGAGELGWSLYNVLHLHLGIDIGRVLVTTLDLKAEGYPQSRIEEIFRRAEERIGRLPGVERVSVAATIPFESSKASALAVPGVPQLPELETGGPYVNAVSPGFFATTGTRLLRGRDFTPQDGTGATLVAVVNQTMARLLWPAGDALGKCLKIGGEEAPCSSVVGIVEDARRSDLQEGPTLQYYVPVAQAPAALSSRALFVRARVDAEELQGRVRQEVQSLEPGLPLVEVRSLQDLVAPQLQPWRMGMAVLSFFGLLALILALVGLYGVIAHTLEKRRYELGVRIAHGAQRSDVLWLVLRQGLVIGVVGAAGGVLLALGTARFLQPLLFQVSAQNPLILGSTSALVVLLALVASWISAQKTRYLDPAVVLRTE
ncbi:MAG: ADOP family duplicated permease [Thermoanaerobaculia bacterium]